MAGSKNVTCKWVSGNQVFYDSSGNVIYTLHGTLRAIVLPSGASVFGVLMNLRTRTTIAAVNTGATLLSAIAGFKYRLVGCKAIAVGGAAGAVTTVDILGTQAASPAKLVAYAQASLTQSTVLSDGGVGGAVLADGASYVQNDVNTAITIGKTGASVTTATAIDTILAYVIEA